MARWNEDMEAVPEGETVILLTWWYHQPSEPFSATANKHRQTGKWRWAGSNEPVLHWDGGNFCEPTGWTPMPKATGRQLAERKGMR